MVTMKNTINFNLEPKSPQIDEAGYRGSCFLKSHGFSDDTVHVPVMILKELIKNGIKYGKFSATAKEINVRIHIAEKNFTIEVRNPVDDTCSEQLKELDKTIQFIRGYQDPYEPYAIMRGKVSNNYLNEKSRGLGLAQIAYEGKALLDFFVTEDNILNITAVGNMAGTINIKSLE
jgi:hypothetical protein